MFTIKVSKIRFNVILKKASLLTFRPMHERKYA